MEITRKDLSIVFRISDYDIEDTTPYSYSVIEKKDSFLKFLRSYGPNQKTYSLKEKNKRSYNNSIRLIDVLGLIDIRDRVYKNLLTNCHLLKDLLNTLDHNSRLELEELFSKTINVLNTPSIPFVMSSERLEHQNYLVDKIKIKDNFFIKLLIWMMEPCTQGYLITFDKPIIRKNGLYVRRNIHDIDFVTNFKLTIEYYIGLFFHPRRQTGIDQFESIHGKIEEINGFFSGYKKSIYEIKRSNFLHKKQLQDEKDMSNHLTNIFSSSI